MKKKLLSLALALVMCLFLLPATALALSDEEIRKMAEELAPYLPDMTVEEIINTLNKEVTPEQDKAFQDALESLYPEFLAEDGVLTGYYGDSSTVIIPDTVTSIGHDAFHDCTELTSVTIPNSVTSIGSSAFQGCTGLTSVTIPSSVTELGLGAFSGCTSLTAVTIPDSLTSISQGAFSSCTGLTSVTIPSSVTQIWMGAFGFSTNLKDVYYTGSQEQWEKIEIWFSNDPLENATIHYNSVGSASSVSPNIFTDVKSSDYFADAVLWAVERNITSGTSKTTFSPNVTCTKAQILTFLWHANGSPEPTAANPFADIQTGDYFYKAALWAAEKGLVSGSTFGANTDCTRAMTVEYMWKAAGSPAPAGKADFDDVPANADYAQAVAWAVEKNITSGTGDGTFSPTATCTRGQIVTFLYRAMGK